VLTDANPPESVTMTNLTHDHNALMIAGPNAIHAAGQAHRLIDFGLLATESMRLEKNYRAWKSDLHTEFTVLEAGLDRFVNMDKDFQGRDAIAAQRDAGHRRFFVAMEVSEPGTELSLEVIGQRCAATVRAEPMFDPDHRRHRAHADGVGHSTTDRHAVTAQRWPIG